MISGTLFIVLPRFREAAADSVTQVGPRTYTPSSFSGVEAGPFKSVLHIALLVKILFEEGCLMLYDNDDDSAVMIGKGKVRGREGERE